MLYLHHSNHLERLAQHFAALQQADPLPPLQPEQVVVQNAGMARWLSLQTARYNGIAANLRYLFPAELTWELLRKVLDDVPERDPCAPATLRWRLLDIFLREPEQWPELAPYLQAGEQAAWQLAGQLSTVFDQYLLFRPAWIDQWEQQRGAGDDWQARLWWRVAGRQNLPHWVRLQARFRQALEGGDKSRLPTRISFFSVPVLSPGYVQLLIEVAQHLDIHIYLMDPSQEYWGDIEPEKRKRKQRAEVQDLITIGNPLLASWGRQGRDFLDQLIEAEAETDELLFEEPAGHGMLQQVQADILHLQMPEEKSPPTPLFQSGGQEEIASKFPPFEKGGLGGIFLHACHAPMREVEVLYDQLLDLFTRHPTLTPADVVVMMPDIDTYAPYIDAVFSTAAYPLPYSIADRSPAQTQGILNLCQQLLELPQGRCDAESVLALLEFEEVRKPLKLDEAQVMQCREWVRAVNIRWGTDAQTRPQQGGASTPEHTWRYGLDRLLLGYALPGEELFAEVLPYNEIEGSQAELLGRLQQWLAVLFGMAGWADLRLDLKAWDARFRAAVQALVGDDAPLSPVWQALDKLSKATQQAAFAQPLTWAVFRQALGEQLQARSAAEGFLGRGITFCALMPMRTVPFRCVALLGMNDGAFPRRDVRASFDRMGQHLRRGDRLKRDEDRYLFLESLLSARDWLYISYIGQSPLDNKPLPPSVLVSELLDYVQRRFGVAREALITQHPLQAFSQRYVRGEGGLFTYFELRKDPRPNLPHFSLLPPSPLAGEGLGMGVSLTDLIRFYQHPARMFLRERFGLHLAEHDEELPAREPFALEKYVDGTIRELIFGRLQQGLDAAGSLPLLRAQGLLPHGTPGELCFAGQVAVTEAFYQSVQPLPATQGRLLDVGLGEFRLTGMVKQLAADGRRIYELSKLSYWQWIDLWLHHLALNVLEDAPCPRRTYIAAPEQAYVLEPVGDAAAQLTQLLGWYWQGLQAPLPFFPKTALNLMEQKDPQIHKALSTWEGSGRFAGESAKPEYQLLYRDTHPLETQADEFMAIAYGVFGQMLSVRK